MYCINASAGVCGIQAEKELSEVTLQLESLHERLEEADGLSSAQVITMIQEAQLSAFDDSTLKLPP